MISPAAWIPLIDPLYSVAPHLTAYWLLFIVPVTLIISLVYQTVRKSDLNGLAAATAWLTIKILLGMAAINAAIYIIYCLAIHYANGPM